MSACLVAAHPLAFPLLPFLRQSQEKPCAYGGVCVVMVFFHALFKQAFIWEQLLQQRREIHLINRFYLLNTCRYFRIHLIRIMSINFKQLKLLLFQISVIINPIKPTESHLIHQFIRHLNYRHDQNFWKTSRTQSTTWHLLANRCK